MAKLKDEAKPEVESEPPVVVPQAPVEPVAVPRAPVDPEAYRIIGPPPEVK